jgi:hypothetical protein
MAEISDQPIVAGQTTAQNEAVETVLQRLDEGEIFVPPYQRDSYEWDTDKKSLFIESILNRLTVPAFYLAPSEADPDRFEVVNGQQRLTTLAAFFRNQYQLEHDEDCPYLCKGSVRNSPQVNAPSYLTKCEETARAFPLAWQVAFYRLNGGSDQGYRCHRCGKLFLGPDDLEELHGDHVQPVK